MSWKKLWNSCLNKIKHYLHPKQSHYDSEFVTQLLFDGGVLKKKYTHLKRVITENDYILDLMAGLSQRDKIYEDPPLFTSRIESILSHVLSFIQALNNLTDNRYIWLYDVYEDLYQKIMSNTLELLKKIPSQKSIYFLDSISQEYVYEVGNKASNLAEIRNALGISTPNGIVISTSSFLNFLKKNNLEEVIEKNLKNLSLKEPDEISKISSFIQDAILNSPIPDDLSKEIINSLKKIGSKYWAVRSSAIGEDGTYSFAGQFTSILNVPTEEVPKAYLKVIASLYQERVLFYRLAHGLDKQPISMAVLVIEMIDAKSSGVIYTLNPTNPTSYEVMISGTWGLGVPVVSGDTQPDIFILDRRTGELKEKKVAIKNIMIAPEKKEGVVTKEVETSLKKIPCINKNELSQLYEVSLSIEDHFKTPQDIEWSIDQKGWLYILQARPLRVRMLIGNKPSPQESFFLKGESISPGVSCGTIFWLKNPKDKDHIPHHAIVVTPNMDPDFAKIVPKIKGLISLKGGATIHLATVLREFQIPALVIPDLSQEKLPNGKLITLDGFEGQIYLGRVENILKGRRKMEFLSHPKQTDKEDKIFEDVLSYILPLTLTEIPEDEEDIPREKIQTIHDLVRFVHEISMREMFLWSREDVSHIAHILDSNLVPMIFYIIDLDDGLVPQVAFKKTIRIEHIRSIPFLALWQGMIHPGVRWAGAVPFEFGSFISIVSRSFVRSKEPPGRAYALLSKEYLNFHSRLAYHFAAVESFCSEKTPASNYITFKFQGGGASLDGRLKRINILERILTHLGLKVSIKADRLSAVIRGTSKEQTQEVLDQLGRLMAYVRQMDMAVSSEETIQKFVEAFLKEDYSVVHR